ncbi:YciI family protein [Thauera sinica]|uniref:YciI family protein n=1 Tax=Thauera sinica TaxID=2665146 RepID=A0ABW1AMW7_9RHOO|nr:YciI family protein [Thauera sp. K11]ATE61648.1 hypothetical protein CCZ27_18280 [Thauera sp. K11]
MYFLVLGTDAPGKSDVRLRTRPQHRAYLRDPDGHPVKVHLGGPTLSADGETMNGTLLVVEAGDIGDVDRFVADDPYSRAGLFARVEVRPWAWSLGTPETTR